MKKRNIDIDRILQAANTGPSKWLLDNIVWHDRATSPTVLIEFLQRIKLLENQSQLSQNESKELEILNDLANDLDEQECLMLISDDEEIVRHNFIEALARTSALQVLTMDKVTADTLETMCKLSPNDFILTSKRTQDIINSVHELVIQGETLSDEVAGA